MSDVAVTYTLTTPGPDIVFNNGVVPSLTNIYYITNVKGLDGAPLRTPQDDKPQAHGGLGHKFWKGARHIVIEGSYLIQSTHRGVDVQLARNVMDAALFAATESLIQADGTLQWMPAGQASRTLTVRLEQPLETDGVELKTWTFGLFAANPDWT